MESELDLDKPAFQQMLLEQYGLDIAQLTFVPRGLASYGYVAEGRDGERAFIKLYDPAHVEPTAIVDPSFTLPVAWSLYHDARFQRLPCPIRAIDGAFMTRFEQYEVVALTYLAGQMLDELPEWPDGLKEQLAQVIGELHASTGRISFDTTRAERFDLSFVNLLTDALDRLEALPADVSPTHAALRSLVLPRRAELLAQIERLGELARAAQALSQAMVLCHTDLWEGNLLLDERGDLYILDWDDIRLAPPEQDLFFYVRGAADERVLDAYEQAYGPANLHVETFGYYEQRRNLDDVTAFVIQLLEPGLEEQDARSSLRFLAGNLDDARNLEARLEAVRALLARRQAIR